MQSSWRDADARHPHFFSSPAPLVPLAVSGVLCPAGLTVAQPLDPLTYAVDPMRRHVFNHLKQLRRRPPSARSGGHMGVARAGRCLRGKGSVVALGLVMLRRGIWRVQRQRLTPPACGARASGRRQGPVGSVGGVTNRRTGPPSVRRRYGFRACTTAARRDRRETGDRRFVWIDYEGPPTRPDRARQADRC